MGLLRELFCFQARTTMEENEEDPFNRLPDDLIVLVFGKVSEAKWLCWCYLVSKRFASIILRTRIVTIKHPKSDENLMFRLLKMPFPCFTPKLHSTYRFSVSKFLKNFTSIEKLEIQAFHPRNVENDFILKGRLYFRNSKVNVFMLLFAIEKDGRDDSATLTIKEREVFVKLLYNQVANVYEGLKLSRYMIKKNIIFQKAVIRNSQNYRTISLGQERAVKITRAWTRAVRENRKLSYKLWYSPALRLSSGRVIKGVKLGLVKYFDDDFVVEDAVMVRKAFQGVGDVDTREAAMEISNQNPVWQLF